MHKITALLFSILWLTSCSPAPSPTHSVISFLDANIPSTDPIHSTNKYSSTIVGSVFEGLYHYHYLKRPLTLEPQLASTMPKVSSDGLTYTIDIKKNVFFQDDPAFTNGKGRMLEAQDFIYSWKRLADPKNKALGWWIFDGLILGLNDWRDAVQNNKADYDTPVAGLKALNKHQLQIRLTKASHQFIHFLATPLTVVVAREVVEKYTDQITNHPVGTGAFLLSEWTRNSKVVLKRNPNYRENHYPQKGNDTARSLGFLKSSGQKLPLADEVVIRIFTERQPLWLSFLKGEIDHGIIPKDNNDQVIENDKIKPKWADKGMRLHYFPRTDVTYIAFNMEDPILGKHPKIRQAMALAIDKKTILEKFYSGRGVLAQSPIPPGLAGYRDSYQSPWQYNIEKARKLLKDAGFPEGKGLPVFNYDMFSNNWSRQHAELLKDYWSRIGIKIQLQANTWPQFDKKIKTKQSTLFDMAWNADYPDAENFMQLFYSKNISPGSNNFNYSNPTFDQLYTDMLAAKSPLERKTLLHKMVELLNKDVPAIFGVHRVFRLPYHGWLNNFYEHSVIYDHLKYLSVDQKRKQELIQKL